MVHFINGPHSGDLLLRAEVLSWINKVRMRLIRMRGLGIFALLHFRRCDLKFSSSIPADNKLFKWLNFNFHALNLPSFSSFNFIFRELQRIESISSAPVISHFSETILGLTTIRAYNQESRFMEMLFKRMEANNVAFVILNSSNRWLGIALVRFHVEDKANYVIEWELKMKKKARQRFSFSLQ